MVFTAFSKRGANRVTTDTACQNRWCTCFKTILEKSSTKRVYVQVHVEYDDVWERRDVLGIHPQKQAGLFWVGACVPAGRLQAEDFHAFADIAER